MLKWLQELVIGDGNVIRERSYTNWNTFDERPLVAEKAREQPATSHADVTAPASPDSGAPKKNA